MRVRTFIATTEGPVSVDGIHPCPLEKSIVCVGGGKEPLREFCCIRKRVKTEQSHHDLAQDHFFIKMILRERGEELLRLGRRADDTSRPRFEQVIQVICVLCTVINQAGRAV